MYPDTLAGMDNPPSTLWNHGRWEEVERLIVQVMETSKTKLGADHPDTLTINLVFTLKNMSPHGDALRLLQTCSTLQQRVLSPDHPHRLSKGDIY